MPRVKKAVPVRTAEEAWEMALENKGLVLYVLYKFLNSHDNIVWYKGDDLKAEFESVAWEGMYNACLLWEPGKGKLSTYAVPAIYHTMLQALDKLMRMGGNMKGGPNLVKKKFDTTPPVFSLEGMSEARAAALEADTVNSYADEIAQPWQDPESEEDRLLGRLDAERHVAKIRELAERMPEPHQSVFKLMVLSPPSQHSGQGPRLRFSGMGIGKASRILHKSDLTVRKLYLESLEWMENQLAAAGYGDEITDG